MNKFRRLHAFYLLVAVVATIAYAAPRLPVPQAAVTGVSENAGARIGQLHIYAFDDGLHGRELWRSDGTAHGTYILRDIFPGAADSDPANFVIRGETVFFKAIDGDGRIDLWRSDGTRSGTMRLQASSSVLMDGSLIF